MGGLRRAGGTDGLHSHRRHHHHSPSPNALPHLAAGTAPPCSPPCSFSSRILSSNPRAPEKFLSWICSWALQCRAGPFFLSMEISFFFFFHFLSAFGAAAWGSCDWPSALAPGLKSFAFTLSALLLTPSFPPFSSKQCVPHEQRVLVPGSSSIREGTREERKIHARLVFSETLSNHFSCS